jgi:hypothetical protein
MLAKMLASLAIIRGIPPIYCTSLHIPCLPSTLFSFCAKRPDWSFVRFQAHNMVKRYNLKRKINQFHSPSSVNFLQTLLRPFSSSACRILHINLYPLPPANNAEHGRLRLFKLDLHSATRIPRYMISYLSSFVERGVTVNVMFGSKNILRSSIDYYRCRKDSLCRDWTDNMDSSLFSCLLWVISNCKAKGKYLLS